MALLRLTLDLEYDEKIMHGDDKESKQWFLSKVLAVGQVEPDDALILHSNYIGDSLGFVRVVSVEEPR